MRLMTVRRPFEEGDEFTLYFFGDLHRHHRNAAKGEMARDRDEIAADPNGICFLMGDSHECISKSDPRYDEDQVDWSLIDPIDMRRLADVIVEDRAEFLRPLTAQLEVDIGGNHDTRYERYVESDLRLRSLERVGKASVWVPGMQGALVRVVFTDKHRHACSLMLNLHHGRRTAAKKATLLNSYLDKLCTHWDGVDFLARGHCHFRGVDDRDKMRANANHSRIGDVRVASVLTGGYLKTYMEDGSSYSEDADLDPIDVGMQRIRVYPTRSGVTWKAIV